MSDENERSVASAGSVKCEPAAWGVMRVGGGWRCIVDSEQQAESLRKGWDRAENWVHEAIPLYRSPTLTDAERDALLDAAEVCDSRERRSIEFRLPQEAEHWRCLAATIRGLSERLSGTQEKCIREECHK